MGSSVHIVYANIVLLNIHAQLSSEDIAVNQSLSVTSHINCIVAR